MLSKDLYYQKYLKYKSKYINLQSQIGGVKEFGKLFTNQPPDTQDEIYNKMDEMDEIPITRTLNTTRRDSVDIKTFTSLKKKLRLDQSIEKEAMFISVPIIVYHPDYLDNNEILMLAKIFIQNSNNPNMTPLINYMTLSPDSNPIQLVNAYKRPLNFNLTKLFDRDYYLDGDYYLNDNQLHFELFFIFICILITNKQIKLTFINLNIYKKSFNTIIFGLKQNIITHLKITNCQIGYEEAKALATALEKNTTLVSLDLDVNSIGDEGAKALATVLEKNTTLQILELYENNIGDEGAKALATALEKNTTLVTLNPNFNSIGDEGAKALATALEKNTTIRGLNLYGNNIGKEGIDALTSVLEKNKIPLRLIDTREQRL